MHQQPNPPTSENIEVGATSKILMLTARLARSVRVAAVRLAGGARRDKAVAVLLARAAVGTHQSCCPPAANPAHLRLSRAEPVRNGWLVTLEGADNVHVAHVPGVAGSATLLASARRR